MDGIAQVAKQQTQANLQDVVSQKTQFVQKLQETSQLAQNYEKEQKSSITNEKEVKKLVKDLNESIEMLHTSLKFGVDKENVFYVSVIDKKTDKVIRRWPAEEAKTILPKMKELTGILFDTKG